MSGEGFEFIKSIKSVFRLPWSSNVLIGLFGLAVILGWGIWELWEQPNHEPDTAPGCTAGCHSNHVSGLPQPASGLDLANQMLFNDEVIDSLTLGTGWTFGYASASSVRQGESIDFHISTASTVLAYDIQLYRLGANGLEPIMRITDLPGGVSYPCGPVGVPAGQESVELGCNWPVAYTLFVPNTWPSGLYLARFLDQTNPPESWGNYIVFVVTEDEPGSTAKILLQFSTNTWQAYNDGYSPWSFYTVPPARRITFDKNFRNCDPSLTSTSCLFNLEAALARWLESEGYAVEYVANEDLHLNPNLLFNYKLFVSVGHDEYWSKEIRDQIDNFIDAGGNVAIFSGNTGYRQVRYEQGLRTLVCYKEEVLLDPLYGVDNIRLATEFAAWPVNWPENITTGVGFRNGGWVNLTPDSEMAGRYTVYHSGHWVYQDTGLQDRDIFWYEPRVQVEVDGALFNWQNGLPTVTGADHTPLNFTILGLQQASQGYGTMGIFTRNGGGTVFNAATMGWARGLWAENNPQDYLIVRQITRNVFNTLSSGAPPSPPGYPITDVSFSYQPFQPVAGELVTFTGAITPSYATLPITYTWNFGDTSGLVSTTTATASHNYASSGSYTVQLTATNQKGTAMQTKVINVSLNQGNNLYEVYLPFVQKEN